MKRSSRQILVSKVTVKSRTVIPRAVRDRLGLRPGDAVRFRLTPDGVVLEKASAPVADDPFLAFFEWSGDADQRAYADL